MTNKEKAYLTWVELQKRKAKKKELGEKEHKDYICKMLDKRRRNWSVRCGGYKW